ncbi:MAG: hypothetical protein JXQ96_12465 [Cyclobacteriaceae bacterium]
MNFFAQNRTASIIIGILIILNLTSMYFFVIHKRIAHRDRHGFNNNREMRRPNSEERRNHSRFIERELGLSTDQQKEFRRLKKEHFQKSADVRKQLREMRNTMFSNINNKAFDLDSMAGVIGTTQARAEVEMYNHFKSVRDICTEDQKKKFDQVIEKMMKRMRERVGFMNKNKGASKE